MLKVGLATVVAAAILSATGIVSAQQLDQKLNQFVYAVETVCANMQQGTRFYNDSAASNFEIFPFGLWNLNIRTNDWFNATGHRVSEQPGRLRVTPVIGRMIMLFSDSRVAQAEGLPFSIFLPPGSFVDFVANDYPDAYHDNAGCLVLLISPRG